MIEKVRNGTWDLDGAGKDHLNAMAAKGYFETHKEVKASIDSHRAPRVFGLSVSAMR